MGNPRGFLDFKRIEAQKLTPLERLTNYKEFTFLLDKETQSIQAGRCMNCGVPFCNAGVIAAYKEVGCPLRNLIPEWNDNIYRDQWEEAYQRLSLTNPFPEFTGRVCPAPCEDSCVCAINGESVTIKNNELAIIENAFKEGFVKPSVPKIYNGKSIAIIGSGPAALACAHDLNLLGYKVKIFERSDRIGGLLMYGIPDMKLEKSIIQRRVALMEQSGIEFEIKQNIDSKAKASKLLKEFDALVLATGASKPIDLDVKGRNLGGIMFALDFLTQSTKSFLDYNKPSLIAKDKNVLVIGSGDTSVDCIAVAARQGAKSIIRFERSPKKATYRSKANPWPLKADIFNTDYGLEEAIAKYGEDPRIYQKSTKEFVGKNGFVEGVMAVDLKQIQKNGYFTNVEVHGSARLYKTDLVLLAIGFGGSENSIKEVFDVEFDTKNNIIAHNFKTTQNKIFTCGDARIGQSLIVWAIKDGKDCAKVIHESLRQN